MKKILIYSIIITLVGFAGCDDSSSNNQNNDAGIDVPEVIGYKCVRDEEMMYRTTQCSEDINCPCGTHCKLGQCGFDCIYDSDCSDGWCDYFGSCRPLTDRESIAGITEGNPAYLDVNPTYIRIFEWSQAQKIKLKSINGTVGSAKLVAGQGLNVDCGNGFGHECYVENLTDGQEKSVSVKTVEIQGLSPSAWNLTVHYGKKIIKVNLSKSETNRIAEVKPGIYEGRISSGKATATLASDVPFETEQFSTIVNGISIPLSLTVYEDGTLEFQNQEGIIPSDWYFKVRNDLTFDAVVGNEDYSRRFLFGTSAPTSDLNRPEVTVSAKGNILFHSSGVNGTIVMSIDSAGFAYAPIMGIDERPTFEMFFSASKTADLPDVSTPPSLESSELPDFETFDDRWAVTLPWSSAVASCGTLTGLSGEDTSEMEGYLCYSLATGSMDSVEFVTYSDSSDLTIQGDLKCDDMSVRLTSFPFFTNGELSVGSLVADQLFTACMTELPGAFNVEAPTTSGSACLNELSGCGSDGVCESSEIPRCINAPLFMHALELGLNSSIERHDFPEMTHYSMTSESSARLVLRLLQQWLQVNAFIAREATQNSDYYLGLSSTTNLSTALDTSLNAWALIFHPGVISRIIHFEPQILADPDYRGDLSSEPITIDRSQAAGLPVVMLDTLSAQLTALKQLINNRHLDGGDIPETISRVLKANYLAYAVAMFLYQKSISEGSVVWEPLWLQAKAGYDQARSALDRSYDNWLNKRNPLGIEDNDLPLYRGLTTSGNAGLRFAAISNYILQNFTLDAIQKATDSRTDAVTAWTELLSRQLQIAQTDSKEEKINEIKRMYGEKILNLCGNPYNLTAEQVLDEENWPGLSADSCFLNVSDSTCSFDEEGFSSALKAEDMDKHMCIMGCLKRRIGQKAELQSSSVNYMIDQMQEKLDEHNQKVLNSPLDFEPIPNNRSEWLALFGAEYVGFVEDQLRCQFGNNTCLGKDVWTLDKVPEVTGEDAKAFEESKALCDGIFGTTQTLIGKIADFTPTDMLNCYKGTIGTQVLAAYSASMEVDTAVSSFADYTEKYKNAIWNCTIDDRALQTSQAVTEQLNAIENYSNSVVTSTNKIAEAGKLAIKGIRALAGTVSNDYSGTVELATDAYSFNVEQLVTYETDALGINTSRALHTKFMTDFSSQIADIKCYHDAEMHLIGAETQAKRVEQARIDLANTLLVIRNSRTDVERFIIEGRNRIKSINDTQRTSLVSDIWQDLWSTANDTYKGKINEYRSAMHIAKRLTYLALRAVEYELQLSETEKFNLRTAIFAAKLPSELQNAADHLELLVAAGNIAGQPAGNRHVEFSLKDHLLQLSDRSDFGDGKHKMTAEERFRAMLVDSRYAVYDETTGDYRGQLIPFSLAPMGSLGLGQTNSIPVLAGEECAERNWSISVSLQGENLAELANTYTQVGILHKNTFYSQKCIASVDEQIPLQVSSVRPARNLFIDPVWGGNYGTSSPGDSEYLIALVDAYHNVEWSEFQSSDYSDGASESLAARSLYGEYGLFISAEKLALGDSDTGLDLQYLDDIWIRYDYVSVAKQW